MDILAKRAADTIFISGSPRTGTTWLGEIVGSCPGIRVVFEPFHKSRTARTRALGRRYLRPEGDYPTERSVLADVLTGRAGDWGPRQVGHRLLPARLAVKSVRGNLMLEYLHRNFQCPVVFITRHPCAVVASRLKMGYPSALSELTSQGQLMEDLLGPYAQAMADAVTTVEQHAALWCAENLLALRQMTEPWQTTVFYEELFSDPRRHVDRVFEAVRLYRTASVDEGLRRVSRTARKDSAVVTGDGVLERWRKDLDRDHVRAVLSMLERFEIDTYGDGPMPRHPDLGDPSITATLSGARARPALLDRLTLPPAARRQVERAAQRAPRTIPFTMPTFCPRLFSEAFVSDAGHVFTCCHFAPFGMGSLAEKNLGEIWNGPTMRAARAMSMHRTLHCHERCTLLDEKERAWVPAPDDGTSMPYGRLRRLKLLMGELCNIACVMCDQDHSSRRQLPLDLLRRRIDWGPIDDIEFQGGEPLAMNEARKAYLYLTEQMGKKVNFLTNGTIMSVEWAERIARGSSWLYFSINGVDPRTHERISRGSRMSRVLRSIDRVRDARSRLSSPLVLVAHFTMVPGNISEAPGFPALGARLGFDRVEFGYDISAVPHFLRTHPAEASGLRRRLSEAIEASPIPVATHRLRYLGLMD